MLFCSKIRLPISYISVHGIEMDERGVTLIIGQFHPRRHHLRHLMRSFFARASRLPFGLHATFRVGSAPDYFVCNDIIVGYTWAGLHSLDSTVRTSVHHLISEKNIAAE